MKKLLLFFICLITLSGNAFANTANSNLIAVNNLPAAPQSAPAVQQRVSLMQCSDTLSMDSEQLFYLTLAALNKMNYKIKEIQSKTGTVLFQAYSREFLVTIADKGSNSTFIKILPTDSNYSFSPAFMQNIFGFLKANASVTPIIL